jgi:hypothetical protein
MKSPMKSAQSFDAAFLAYSELSSLQAPKESKQLDDFTKQELDRIAFLLEQLRYNEEEE